MKDEAIKVWINQIAVKVDEEMNREQDCERNCRLQDVKELLRQAWHMADGSPCEPFDLLTRP